ncbi:MAG: metal-dependent hydrolase [Anaerolineales bacterium]|nr:metal-dependent hydrolase [Anaerolineales bacterium]
MSTKVTWYGHASMGVHVDDMNILVDPFFSGNPAAAVDADSVNADFILVSHGHGDHVGDTIQIARRTGATVIANSEVANWLRVQGLNVHAQHIGGGYHHPFGYLKLTLALHGSSMPDGSYGGNPCGFLLTTSREEKLYFACDTGLFGDMRLIGEEGIALAVLPIGDNYTMGPDDALRAVHFLKPQAVIPIHYNTWDLIKQDPEAWAVRVEAETDAHAVVLMPGQQYSL